jgi:hypothetical protein
MLVLTARTDDDFLNTQGNPLLTLRASCVRTGKHAYKSVEVTPIIGSAVLARPGVLWNVKLKAADIEVVAILCHEHLVVGISLDPISTFQQQRIAPERVPGRPTLDDHAPYALRRSTAYIMLQLARLGADPLSTTPPAMHVPPPLGVVVDGCAGKGTIPFEAAIAPTGYGIGGEFEVESVRAMAEYYADHRNATVSGLQWDARRLPLRDHIADSYVADLPFGVKCMNAKRLEALYPKLVQEAARVLVPGSGVLIALTVFLFYFSNAAS